MNQTMKAHQPAHEDGWEAEEYEAAAGPNVLWGRVVALAALVLIAFFLGRWSAAGGPDESDLQALRAELQEVSAENETLENELAAQALLLEEQTAAAATDDQAATDDEAAAENEAAEEDGVDGNGATDPVGEDEGLAYKVQPGDTLRAIARRFCGDVELGDMIGAKNNIKDPTALKAGQLLKLPAECAR